MTDPEIRALVEHTKSDLLALADEVERIDGPSREIDLRIHNMLYPNSDLTRITTEYRRGLDSDDGYSWDIVGESVCYQKYSDGRCWHNGGEPLPRYTSSIGAALKLVPEGYAVTDFMIWPGEPASLTLYQTRRRNWPKEPDNEAWVHASKTDKRWTARASIPALALCAAALRARAAMMEDADV